MRYFLLRGLEARRNRKRAGRRARRKYAQLRREWLRRTRWRWVAAGLTLAVMWLVLVWAAARVPWFPDWFAAALGGALVGVFVAARHSPPLHVATWEAGAWGEEATAKELTRLEAEGWVVLHDLANGSKNFDHVVLGPRGVFCLNSKWSGYDLQPEGDRLVARHRYDDEIVVDIRSTVRKVRAEAAELSTKIRERCGEKIWVQPVVVWWGEVDRGGRQIDGVGVVQGANIVAALRKQPGREVERFADVVAALRPGRRARGRAGRLGAWPG